MLIRGVFGESVFEEKNVREKISTFFFFGVLDEDEAMMGSSRERTEVHE